MRIEGTSAVVTGGGSGLGEATARLLAKLGAVVHVFDRNQAAAEKVATEIGGVALSGDVTSEDDAAKALDVAAKAGDGLRILVNCAGIGTAGRIVGKTGPMPLADFERVIRVNLIGTFNMMRLAADRMSGLPERDDKARGVIVNTASVAAFEGTDRPGRLCGLQGRHRFAGFAGGTRILPLRHSRQHGGARHLPDAAASRAAAGGAGQSCQRNPLSVPARRSR
jgi:NAD(P)-dependent dehydrogenase (short-subunit alcohol dehydrogenase family)